MANFKTELENTMSKREVYNTELYKVIAEVKEICNEKGFKAKTSVVNLDLTISFLDYTKIISHVDVVKGHDKEDYYELIMKEIIQMLI